MMSGVIKVFDKVAESPIWMCERLLDRLGPGFNWGDFCRLLAIGFFAALSGVGLLNLEVFLSSRLPHVEWLQFFHEPLFLLVGLFSLPSVYLCKLVSDYRKDRVQLREKIEEVKQSWENLKDPSVAVALIKSGLEACADHRPIKVILDALEPGNMEIVGKLNDMSKETVQRLELLSKLLTVPEPVRNTLANFFQADLMAKPWGPLFMTFAIQLQLDPWVRAQQQSRFVFIRDFDEFACFFDKREDAVAEFRERLERDLEAVLALVTGTLWSVMFKDLPVWNQDAYIDSNERLLQRTKGGGTDLRRLFIYEEGWLDDTVFLRALARAAIWHNNKSYPCRFAQFKASMTPLVERDDSAFVASCLINGTRIMMYQHLETNRTQGRIVEQDGGHLARYVYRCDAGSAIVNAYKREFEQIWNKFSDAATPDKFLERLKVLNPAVVSQVEKELRGTAVESVLSHD